MLYPRLTARSFALASVLLLGLAACGDDDVDDSASQGAEAPSGETSSDNQGDSGSADGGNGGGGAPYSLFASSLHSGVDLPAPGTAVVSVDGTTYEFDQVDRCELTEVDEGRAEGFVAEGETTIDDGRTARFSMFRSVDISGKPATGGTYETDSLNLFVQQELDDVLESNSYLRGDRMEDDGPVQGRADEMPFIFVVDDGGSLSASGVGEVDYLTDGLPDAAPTGDATFVVNCG